MPPYCIVCNKDLALDPTAEPPLCGEHARAQQLQAQKQDAEANRAQFLQTTLPARPACLVHFSDRPYPLLIKYNKMTQALSAFVAADRIDNSGKILERMDVRHVNFVGRREDSTPGRDEEQRHWIKLPDPAPIYYAFESLHASLVQAGWRPVLPVREAGFDVAGGGSLIPSHLSLWKSHPWEIDLDTLDAKYYYRLLPEAPVYELWKFTRHEEPKFYTPYKPQKKRRFGIF